MVQGQYPIINQGLGKLTPDVWSRLMNMLRTYEQKSTDERARAEGGGGGSGGGKPFLAKIRKAKCIAANRYKYSWIQVALQDDNSIETVTDGKSSTVEGDDYALAAINLIEIQNTTLLASAGVNMGADQYPVDYNLQLMGGGSGAVDEEITPNVDCVVLLHSITGTSIEKGEGTTSRYIFSNVNDHDGICGQAVTGLLDPSTEPPTTEGYGFIWLENDGLHWKDKDGMEWTIDDTIVP